VSISAASEATSSVVEIAAYIRNGTGDVIGKASGVAVLAIFRPCACAAITKGTVVVEGLSCV
jgi:hypothetical protein